MSGAPKRPALRYFGGKWRLAPWILSHFPEHRIYVEPFGGAASVLLRKPRSYAEVYNDLSGEVVNLFRVLQDDEACARLVAAVHATPFARSEFKLAYEATEDPVESARRLLIRSFMGFGSNGHNKNVGTGFRANSNRSGTTPARDWANLPENVRQVGERFRGVVIEHRPAVTVMLSHDGPETLHYLDPPYVHTTRSGKMRSGGEIYHSYDFEMTDADHRALADCARAVKGMVVISGYPSDLYDDELFSDWLRIERQALADGARERVEVLWINSQCVAALDRERGAGPLFETAEVEG